MNINTKTVSYSMIKTIMTIMGSNILRTMYKSKFNIDFNMIITNMKFDLLTEELKDYIRDTFNDIITQNQDFLILYNTFSVPKEMKEFDIKSRNIIPRRITLKYLRDKSKNGGLTENERMVKFSIYLSQLSIRIHNMGKHNKCTDIECRDIISGVKTMFKKSEPTLRKYGRKGEHNFDE